MIENKMLLKLARRLESVLAFIGSYYLSVIILTFMLILTFVGTLAQANQALYVVQQKYFGSVFLLHHLYGPISIPLPGGYLLMLLLFNNLLVGGIIRAQWRWRSPGMLIAHGGILFLLIGGFVSHNFSLNGGMQLYEGESSNIFRSFDDWVIEVQHDHADGHTSVYEIPHDQLKAVGDGQLFTLSEETLPVDVTVAGYTENSRPRPMQHNPHAVVVDGFYLQTLPPAAVDGNDVPGAYIYLNDKTTDTTKAAIVWGREQAPYVTTINGERWSASMTLKNWKLPFRIALDKFTVKLHPNTGMAKVFMSDVTKIEGHSQESLKITMNEPFRHKGYTLFQSSWGPQNAPPNARLYSGFAVVKNPVDHWPLYACIIVSLGLLIHLFQKLVAHLREGRKTC
jgi:hypothetical protein